jgi:exosortase A-associated hydrolase 2
VTLTDAVSPQPLFLPGEEGPLYALYRGAPSAGKAVLLVAPFAEEMNKSRRMFTLTADALRDRGVASLVVDLFGTGDSTGDFAAARWATWRSDIVRACDWLRARGHAQIALLGLRMGALLALDVARACPGIARVMLWQPVLAGDALITQFLRADVVARMLTQADSRSTTDTLRAQLRNGELIEVAGYTLAPELVEAIERLRLDALAPANGVPVDWIELVSDPARGGTPAGERVRREWQQRGIPLRFRTVVGPPFWSSVEIAVAPELVQATVALLSVAE